MVSYHLVLFVSWRTKSLALRPELNDSYFWRIVIHTTCMILNDHWPNSQMRQFIPPVWTWIIIGQNAKPVDSYYQFEFLSSLAKEPKIYIICMNFVNIEWSVLLILTVWIHLFDWITTLAHVWIQGKVLRPLIVQALLYICFNKARPFLAFWRQLMCADSLWLE